MACDCEHIGGRINGQHRPDERREQDCQLSWPAAKIHHRVFRSEAKVLDDPLDEPLRIGRPACKVVLGRRCKTATLEADFFRHGRTSNATPVAVRWASSMGFSPVNASYRCSPCCGNPTFGVGNSYARAC